MEYNINMAIVDTARQLRISRKAATQLIEDAQIALENACDSAEEVVQITLDQVVNMARDMYSRRK